MPQVFDTAATAAELIPKRAQQYSPDAVSAFPLTVAHTITNMLSETAHQQIATGISNITHWLHAKTMFADVPGALLAPEGYFSSHPDQTVREMGMRTAAALKVLPSAVQTNMLGQFTGAPGTLFEGLNIEDPSAIHLLRSLPYDQRVMVSALFHADPKMQDLYQSYVNAFRSQHFEGGDVQEEARLASELYDSAKTKAEKWLIATAWNQATEFMSANPLPAPSLWQQTANIFGGLGKNVADTVWNLGLAGAKIPGGLFADFKGLVTGDFSEASAKGLDLLHSLTKGFSAAGGALGGLAFAPFQEASTLYGHGLQFLQEHGPKQLQGPAKITQAGFGDVFGVMHKALDAQQTAFNWVSGGALNAVGFHAGDPGYEDANASLSFVLQIAAFKEIGGLARAGIEGIRLPEEAIVPPGAVGPEAPLLGETPFPNAKSLFGRELPATARDYLIRRYGGPVFGRLNLALTEFLRKPIEEWADTRYGNDYVQKLSDTMGEKPLDGRVSALQRTFKGMSPSMSDILSRTRNPAEIKVALTNIWKPEPNVQLSELYADRTNIVESIHNLQDLVRNEPLGSDSGARLQEKLSERQGQLNQINAKILQKGALEVQWTLPQTSLFTRLIRGGESVGWLPNQGLQAALTAFFRPEGLFQFDKKIPIGLSIDGTLDVIKKGTRVPNLSGVFDLFTPESVKPWWARDDARAVNNEYIIRAGGKLGLSREAIKTMLAINARGRTQAEWKVLTDAWSSAIDESRLIDPTMAHRVKWTFARNEYERSYGHLGGEPLLRNENGMAQPTQFSQTLHEVQTPDLRTMVDVTSSTRALVRGLQAVKKGSKEYQGPEAAGLRALDHALIKRYGPNAPLALTQFLRGTNALGTAILKTPILLTRQLGGMTLRVGGDEWARNWLSGDRGIIRGKNMKSIDKEILRGAGQIVREATMPLDSKPVYKTVPVHGQMTPEVRDGIVRQMSHYVNSPDVRALARLGPKKWVSWMRSSAGKRYLDVLPIDGNFLPDGSPATLEKFADLKWQELQEQTLGMPSLIDAIADGGQWTPGAVLNALNYFEYQGRKSGLIPTTAQDHNYQAPAATLAKYSDLNNAITDLRRLTGEYDTLQNMYLEELARGSERRVTAPFKFPGKRMGEIILRGPEWGPYTVAGFEELKRLEQPGYLYHATTISHLGEIRSKGLLPGEHPSEGNVVWFGPDMGAMGQRRVVSDSPGILLRIKRGDVPDATRSMQNRMFGGEEHEVTTPQTVSPELLDILGEDQQWHPLLGDVGPNQNLLNNLSTQKRNLMHQAEVLAEGKMKSPVWSLNIKEEPDAFGRVVEKLHKAGRVELPKAVTIESYEVADKGTLNRAERIANSISEAAYHAMPLLSWTSTNGPRGSALAQIWDRLYKDQVARGVDPAKAMEASKWEAARLTSDRMYHLAARSSGQYFLRNAFWFLPAYQEIADAYFHRLPRALGGGGAVGQAVGLVQEASLASAVVNFGKGLGIIQTDKDGKDRIHFPWPILAILEPQMIPGLIALKESGQLDGGANAIDIYGYPHGLSLIGEGFPTVGAGLPGIALQQAAKQWGGMFEAAGNALLFGGPAADLNLFPQSLNDVISWRTGSPSPLEVLSQDSQQRAHAMAFNDAGAFAAYLMNQEGNPFPGPGATDKVRQTWFHEWHDRTESIYKGRMAFLAASSAGSPIALHISTDYREQINNIWNKALKDKTLSESEKAWLQSWGDQHPGSILYQTSRSVAVQATPNGPVWHGDLDGPFYNDQNGLLRQTLTPAEQFVAARGLNEQMTRSEAIDAGLTEISPTHDPAEIVRNLWKKGDLMRQQWINFKRFQAHDPDAWAWLQSQQQRWAYLNPSKAPKETFTALRVSELWHDLDSFLPKFSPGGYTDKEFRAFKAQIASLWGQGSDFGKPQTELDKAMHRYWTSIQPYYDQLDGIYRQIKAAKSAGTDTTAFYDNLRDVENQWNTKKIMVAGERMPSPQEASFSALHPKDQQAQVLHWQSLNPEWLSTFQVEKAGYPKNLEPMFLEMSKVEDNLNKLKTVLGTETTKNLQTTQFLGIAAKYGADGLKWVQLAQGAPIDRMVAAQPHLPQGIIDLARSADGIAGIATAQGVEFSGHSQALIPLKLGFYAQVDQAVLYDPEVAHFLTDVAPHALADPTDGPIHGDRLYDALFFGAFSFPFVRSLGG